MAAITPTTSNASSVAASSNTRSGYIKLNRGKNRISVYSTSWSGSKAAALEYLPIPDDDSRGSAKDKAGDAVSFTANDFVDMEGPGYVCINVTNANSAVVNLLVQPCGQSLP